MSIELLCKKLGMTQVFAESGEAVPVTVLEAGPNSVVQKKTEETDGYDAYLSWGGTGNKGDWRLGIWWAHIETLAVVASYAQDDWVRWGSATQTDSSDFEGFELRAAYGLGNGQNIVARLYLVEAITSGQDGSRFRIDYNFKF